MQIVTTQKYNVKKRLQPVLNIDTVKRNTCCNGTL